MPPTKTNAPSFPSQINLPKSDRQALIQLLNQHLANTTDLHSQLKQAHWNVKGMHFIQLHELFDNLAGELFPFIDMIAERVTTLGGVAFGTARMAAANSTLAEYPLTAIDGPAHLKALIVRFAEYSTAIRKAIDQADQHGDKATADLFTEVSRTADKQLWFLEAHCQA